MTIKSTFGVARVYADYRQIGLSTVGRLGMGHGHFFERLAGGRVTLRRADLALQWFSDHWPANIPRRAPEPDHKAA